MGQPIAWSFAAVTDSSGALFVELTATAETGWHLYATELPSDEGPIATSFTFTPSENYSLSGPLLEPGAIEEYDPNFAMLVRYHGGVTRFKQGIIPNGTGAFVVEGVLEYMCCNDHTCLPPLRVPFRIPIAGITPQIDR
jgi:hypothetical protein